jgi:16S rRNA U1498 N3-methylase RsmE
MACMGFKTKSQKIASIHRKAAMQSSAANVKPAVSTSSNTADLLHDIQKTLLLTVVIILLLVILKIAQLKNYF